MNNIWAILAWFIFLAALVVFFFTKDIPLTLLILVTDITLMKLSKS